MKALSIIGMILCTILLLLGYHLVIGDLNEQYISIVGIGMIIMSLFFLAFSIVAIIVSSKKKV